jgi:type II secretory pathway component PulK
VAEITDSDAMQITFQRGRRSGIALIIVLLVIVVLAIMAGGFAYSMKVETKLARNASFDNEFEWLGRSGIEAAKYVLGQDGQGPLGQVDSLNEVWAGGPGTDTNDMVAAFPLSNFEVEPGRSFSVKIVDLDRKFNINLADEMILRQALTLVGVDPSSHSAIMDSILDWRDPDENTRVSGVESEHYERLSPPYLAKNGNIDDLSELLLVNGITPEMYWGSSASGHYAVLNRVPEASRSHFDEPVYAIGLRDLFTALSGRALNINTAGATTLQVLPPVDENVAQAIIQRRAGPDGADGTQDDTPFRNPGEIANIPGLPPPVIQQIGRYLSTRSVVFEITVEAKIGNMKRTYVATVQRNNARDIRTLTMYWQ